MHALWNALIKTSPDVSLDTALVACTAAVLAAMALPFVGLPAPASWPYLAASWLFQLAYYRLLGFAYRDSDLSHAYPLMRGLAPPLVATAGVFVLDDARSPWLWAGVGLISAGVLTIGASRRMFGRLPSRATCFAIANAAVIATYTLLDGIGVRHSGNAMSYGLWLFFLIGLPTIPAVILRRGARALAQHLRREWRRSLASATLMVGVYLIALWAMTQAPVAAVAALRETSVIFAAVIGAVWLKEPFGRRRIAGACIVAAGIAVLKA